MIDPDLSIWLVQLARAARGFGLADLPDNFDELAQDAQAQIAAVHAMEIRRRADKGDRNAVGFFKTHAHWPYGIPSSPKHARTKPTVGFLTPSMTYPGGAESWIRMLVSRKDDRFNWSGVAVTGKHRSLESFAFIEQFCPVLVGVYSAPVLARESDVLIVWGIDDPEYLVPDFTGKFLSASHGCGGWTEFHLRTAAKWETKAAGVSKAAAASYPEGVTAAVVWNGIDPPDVGWDSDREATRTKWGLGTGEKAVGFVGRYSWDKNPVAAAQAVRYLGPGHRAVYIGDGWKADQVKAAVRRCCPDAIFVPKVSDIWPALAALDCFVLASPSEGMSLGLIEAWMAGLPVVATRVGAVPELEDHFGRMVHPVPIKPSGRVLAEAAREAMAETATWKRAQAVALEHLTADKMAQRWNDLISETINVGGD